MHMMTRRETMSVVGLVDQVTEAGGEKLWLVSNEVLVYIRMSLSII